MSYGFVAEFSDADALTHAALSARAQGFTRLEGYAPYLTEELADVLGGPKSRVPLLTLIGGILGGTSGYFMMWFSATIHYPINVGGRPLHSWPAFVPITFEMTVLVAALSAVFGMFALNGLPRFHHPIFETPHFPERNAQRFYLCILAQDPQFSADRTPAFLRTLEPNEVWEVPS